jgi:2-oxoglutarate ferredoxin oxidoreductase subunit beta
MKPLVALGHDPADRLRAMALAQDYGRELHTGVLYRNPEPTPTLEALVRERQQELAPGALPPERILELFAVAAG